jgi:hypothetical protein
MKSHLGNGLYLLVMTDSLYNITYMPLRLLAYFAVVIKSSMVRLEEQVKCKKMRNTLTVLVGEPEGKRTLESNTLINYMWG